MGEGPVDNGLLGGLTTPAPPFSLCVQGCGYVDNPVENPFLWITLWKTSSSNLAGLWKTRPVENPLWITKRLEVDPMPPGSKPQPAGKSDQRETVFKWQLAETEGWQHGKIPPPSPSLSAHGKRAWKTWMNAWWASFYSAEDLPGLQLLVMLYDKVMLEEIDVTKILPLLDRYGITPKGRQDLRWAQLPSKAEASTPTPEVQDEIAERRQTRRSKLA